MNNLFVDLLDKGVVIFLDNILIYSMTAEQHCKLLEKVLTHLFKHIAASILLKAEKVQFTHKTTTYKIGDNLILKTIKI